MKWIISLFLSFSVLYFAANAVGSFAVESFNYEKTLDLESVENSFDDSDPCQDQSFFEDDILHVSDLRIKMSQVKNFKDFHHFIYSEPFLRKQIRPPRS